MQSDQFQPNELQSKSCSKRDKKVDGAGFYDSHQPL
jgi:hypothetical protein